MKNDKPENIPAQEQNRQPGFEAEMNPQRSFALFNKIRSVSPVWIFE